MVSRCSCAMARRWRAMAMAEDSDITTGRLSCSDLRTSVASRVVDWVKFWKSMPADWYSTSHRCGVSSCWPRVILNGSVCGSGVPAPMCSQLIVPMDDWPRLTARRVKSASTMSN